MAVSLQSILKNQYLYITGRAIRFLYGTLLVVVFYGQSGFGRYFIFEGLLPIFCAMSIRLPINFVRAAYIALASALILITLASLNMTSYAFELLLFSIALSEAICYTASFSCSRDKNIKLDLLAVFLLLVGMLFQHDKFPDFLLIIALVSFFKCALYMPSLHEKTAKTTLNSTAFALIRMFTGLAVRNCLVSAEASQSLWIALKFVNQATLFTWSYIRTNLERADPRTSIVNKLNFKGSAWITSIVCSVLLVSLTFTPTSPLLIVVIYLFFVIFMLAIEWRARFELDR